MGQCELSCSGAHFERLGSGGDAQPAANRSDSNDSVAITMLGVSLKPIVVRPDAPGSTDDIALLALRLPLP
ncbi:hypothetical protein ACWCQS_35155 [Streptomyces sp. NPDC002076]